MSNEVERLLHSHREDIAGSGLFDAGFYAERYLGDAAGVADPLAHFLTVGMARGHLPSAVFDPLVYRLLHGEPDRLRSFLAAVAGGAAGVGLGSHATQLFPGLDALRGQLAFPLPDYDIAETMEANRAHATAMALPREIPFVARGGRYKLVVPESGQYLDRLETGRPYAMVRLPHGFWDSLYAYRSLAEYLAGGGHAALLNGEETEALALRLARYLFPDNGTYVEGFIEELLADITRHDRGEAFIHGISFKGYPTADEGLFNARNVTPLHTARLEVFARYFAPREYLLDATLWKRWVISGAAARLPGLCRGRKVVLVASDLFADLGARWGLDDYEHVEIRRTLSQAIRHQLLERCLAALSAARPGRPPVVLFQCGASLAYWLITRLYARFPEVFYLDLGQAINAWFLDRPELFNTHWMQIYPEVIVRNCRLQGYYKALQADAGEGGRDVAGQPETGAAMADTAAANTVIALGMHRSGTSALAGCLAALGFTPGGKLLPPSKFNPKGYWEDSRIVAAHDKLLEGFGMAWHSAASLPSHWDKSPQAEECLQTLRDILEADFLPHRNRVLKDPRLCRLLPMWQQLFDGLAIAPKFILALRSPAEVAASLKRRNGFGEEHAALLWLLYVIEAELWSRGHPRCFITYEELLADPVACLRRIDQALDLGLDWEDPAKIEAVQGAVSADLRHGAPGLATDSEVLGYASELYALLAADPVGQIGAEAYDRALRKTLSFVFRPRRTTRPRILVYSGDDRAWACAQIRLLQPFAYLEKEFELVWGVKPRTGGGHYNDLALLATADLVVLQRFYVVEQHKEYVETILNSGLPVLFEMDDLLFDLPPENPHYPSALANRDYILSVIDRVDGVVVSTPALAEAVRAAAHPKQVHVLANSIDPVLFHREPARHDGPVRIGLAGTLTHKGDYEIVEKALGQVLSKYARKVLVVFMGATPERWRNHPSVTSVEFVPDYKLYAKTLPRFELDIALVPLEDNAFNRCKSDIKWLEYSAAGVAGIYSDVAAYAGVRDGETGLKVANTTQAWLDAITDLVEHPDKRLAIARNAQAEVLGHHTAGVRAKAYAQLYGRLAAAQPRHPEAVAQPVPEGGEPAPASQLYEVWQAAHAPRRHDLEWAAERIAALAEQPLFHLGVIALQETEAGLAETIKSLGQQFYQNWRLTIVAETPAPEVLGEMDRIRWLQVAEEAPLAVLNQAFLATPADWLGMVEAGDRLAPHALFAFADKLDRRPDWQLAYSDEDSLDVEGRRDLPFFKTDFNLEMLRAAPFTLGGLMLARQPLFAELGGYQPELEGAEGYDLALRAWERCGTAAIGHVADVLYHRYVAGGHSRREPEIIQIARRVALDEHFLRLGIQAELEDGRLPGTTRVRYRHETQPLVSIIIPTRNQVHFLQRCLETLIEKTAYGHYEVLVVDNGSDERQAVDYLATLRRAPADRMRVIDHPGPFNFSAMNNRAAREARGDYLVLLNNDTAVLEGDWLDEMLALARLSDVGIVGARLLFPNGSIQHAGVILGIGDAPAEHPFCDHPKDDLGYFGRLALPQELSAVSAACMMVRKAVYDRVGGLDEGDFKVSYNDIDFCLKVREAGFRIVWTPYATLLHEGSASQTRKGVEQAGEQAKKARFRTEREAMYRKWAPWIAFDPAYNRNLSANGRDFLVELAPALCWDPEWRPRPRILAHPADRMGCGEYRIIAPMRALNEAGRVMGWETGKYLSIPELLRMEPDSVVFQRQVEWSQIELMEGYIRHSKAFRIFEIDDLITNIPIKSSRKKVFVEQKDLIKRFRKAVSLCHRFVVSTEYLAEEYRGYTDEVIAVPNYLERSRWGGLTPLRRQGAKARVGWAGSTTHDGDLAEIVDVVKATADEVDWVFFGMCPAELRPLVREFHEPVPLEDYAAKLATLDLDLAVAPLEDVPFNHGKSHLRLLEYGVMGYPVICTDITPYRGAYPVTRVANRFKDWVEAIREHVADRDELARRGDALREHINAEWILEDHLDVWLKAWSPS